jgi:alkanesulfonate monooxygenase SsuD/methylene tetrahydromethanopterin reductase-like flavin-dependent oxidoreductase (luciferase family)
MAPVAPVFGLAQRLRYAVDHSFTVEGARMQGRGLAVSVMPLEHRREALVTTGVAADRLGYDGFFLPEAWGWDMTVLLAETATKTARITLGTGILGVWGRSPGQLAMAAATLAAVSGGRFVLGLGASSPQLTEGLHDLPFSAPVARMRRAVSQVRALLAGDRVPLAVTTSARALRLNVPAGLRVPIYLAALADASVRLAGEVADGWIPFMYPLSQLAAGQRLLREGAARTRGAARVPRAASEHSGGLGGPSRPPMKSVAICPSVLTIVETDPVKALEGAAWFVSFYVTTMGSLYRQSLVRQGFGKEVEAVLDANTPKFRAAVPPVAERLLDELAVYGTPDEACARLERWYAAGAALPILLLKANLTPAELHLTLNAFRPALDARASHASSVSPS